jgi:hypothetical protein
MVGILMLLPCVNQAQETTFTTVFYDATPQGYMTGYSLIETPDSSFLIVGEQQGKPLILKMDRNGQMIWEKIYNLSAMNANFSHITKTLDGNYFVAGHTEPYDPSNEILYLKINPMGTVLWGQTFMTDVSHKVSWMEPTSDQGCILAIYNNYFSDSPYSSLLIKFDATGTICWSRKISTTEPITQIDIVRELPDGTLMLGGSMRNSFDHGHKALMVNLSANGEIIWGKKHINHSDTLTFIQDVLVLDTSLTWLMSFNEYESSLFSTNFSSEINWSKRNPVGNSWTEQFLGKPKLHQTLDHGYIYVGMGYWTGGIKTDSLGNSEWCCEIYLDNVDVIPASDSGFLFFGNGPIHGVSLAPDLDPQIGLIKTNSSGEADDCIYAGFCQNDTLALVFDTVTVFDSIISIIPSAIDPEIDTLLVWTWDGCVAMTGSLEEEQEMACQLNISPNPSGGLFTISMKQEILSTFPNSTSLSSLEIFDLTGKKVYGSSTPLLLPSTLNLSHLPEGIYLIRWANQTSHGTAKLSIIK